MAALSQALLAVLQAGGPWFWGLELGTNALRFAQGDYASQARGLYNGTLVDLSDWTQALSDRKYALEASQVSATLVDDDLAISKAVGGLGASPTIARGAAAQVRVGSPLVAPKDYHTAWVGIVDTYELLGARRWALRLRVNDLPLTRPFPRSAWILNRADFPAAPRTSWGQLAPIIYGRHDSVGSTAEGAVPLIRVGAGLYLGGAGCLKDVLRVYVDKEARPTGWGVLKTPINGRSYTRVEFDSDPGPDAEVTADVEGLTTSGDGSGSLIEDPVDQLADLLHMWVYGNYQSGVRLTATAPLDTTSWAEVKAFLQACAGHKTGRRIAGDAKNLPTGEQIFNEWCGSLAVGAYWTDAGQLALAAVDHRVGTSYITSPWIRAEGVLSDGEPGEDLSVPYDVQNIVDRVTVSFLEVGGGARETLEVRDQSLTGSAAEDPIAMRWSLAAAVA